MPQLLRPPRLRFFREAQGELQLKDDPSTRRGDPEPFATVDGTCRQNTAVEVVELLGPPPSKKHGSGTWFGHVDEHRSLSTSMILLGV